MCSSNRPVGFFAPRAASWCARRLANWAAAEALTRIWSPALLLEAHLRLRTCLKGSRCKVFRLKPGRFSLFRPLLFVVLTGPLVVIARSEQIPQCGGEIRKAEREPGCERGFRHYARAVEHVLPEFSECQFQGKPGDGE